MRLAKIFLALIALLIISGYGLIIYKSGAANHELSFRPIKLQSTEDKLNSINLETEKLKVKLNDKSSKDQKTIDTLNQQIKEKDAQHQELEKQIQSKAEEKRKIAEAAANAVNTLTATSTANAEPAPTPVYSGSHEDWMSAAGIAPSDYAAVDYIISHESGWRVDAYNSSGATGLCQALPASKMASAGGDYLTNPVTQLKWCSDYAASRYGGWWGAQSAWVAQQWW